MDKKKKLIITAVLIIVVIALIYWFFLRKKEVKTDAATVDSGSGVFPLKKGSRGKEVEQVQIYLLREYGAQYPKSGIDGIWGNETDVNVTKFLKKDNVSEASYNKWSLGKIGTSKFK